MQGNSPSVKKQDTGWAPTFPVQPSMTLAKSPSPLQSKTAFDDIIKLQVGTFSYLKDASKLKRIYMKKYLIYIKTNTWFS